MNMLKLFKSSLKRDGAFGIVNIIGLSVGMAMSLLIVWYLYYHFSFDSHIPERDKLFSVVQKDRHDGSLSFGNPLPLADAIQTDYPGEGEVTALSHADAFPVTVGGIEYTVKAAAASQNIFHVLGWEFLVGSGETALAGPDNSVITQSCARRLFGSANPVGQIIKIKTFGGERVSAIAGIIKDSPVNSGFDAEMYLSWELTNPPDWRRKWWWGGTSIVVKAANETQKANLEQKMNTILARHHAPYIEGRYDFRLIPLRNWDEITFTI